MNCVCHCFNNATGNRLLINLNGTIIVFRIKQTCFANDLIRFHDLDFTRAQLVQSHTEMVCRESPRLLAGDTLAPVESGFKSARLCFLGRRWKEGLRRPTPQYRRAQGLRRAGMVRDVGRVRPELLRGLPASDRVRDQGRRWPYRKLTSYWINKTFLILTLLFFSLFSLRNQMTYLGLPCAQILQCHTVVNIRFSQKSHSLHLLYRSLTVQSSFKVPEIDPSCIWSDSPPMTLGSFSSVTRIGSLGPPPPTPPTPCTAWESCEVIPGPNSGGCGRGGGQRRQFKFALALNWCVVALRGRGFDLSCSEIQWTPIITTAVITTIRL